VGADTKYWIVCISKDHTLLALKWGIIQACHGKRAPLARMKKGDGIIIYSSKFNISDPKSTLRAFTAIGEIADDDIYQYEIHPDFIPHRRKVNYFSAKEVPIEPLIDELDFIPNKRFWGYPFKYGFLEISKRDFELISSHMRG
jgi:predicted RNA-binding protein